MIPTDYTSAYREANYAQLNEFVQGICNNAKRERDERMQKMNWDAHARCQEQLMKDIGYPPPLPKQDFPQPEPVLLCEEDGLQFYRANFRVAEQLDCYGILVKPATEAKLPLCVLLHGAGGCPEMITGMDLTANYYDAGKRLVKQNWLVFAPLMLFRPFLDGEKSGIPEGARPRLDALLRAADSSLVALEMFKILRSVDILQARPDVQTGRVGIAGLSFGGFYTLLCAAADARFDPIYSSCFFADQLSRANRQADAALMEFLWRGSALRSSCAELAMLALPRTLILEAGIGDSLFPINTVRSELMQLQKAAEALDCADKLHYIEHNGQHEFGLKDALAYFK